MAADNYLAAASLGGLVETTTGITGKTFTEAELYETRKLTRAERIEALEQSFALMKQAMAATKSSTIDDMTNYYGPKRPVTVRRAWIGVTTHVHEHLGQLIAYARSNKIVPPWSK